MPAPIHLSPPDLRGRERELLMQALDSGWLAPAGPDVDRFEADLAAVTGVPHVVALSSGTAALHLLLLELGVRPGDEVLVSTFTFAATANAVRYCGAEPVFIDSDRATWNMDPDLLAEALVQRRPRAVVVVDLYGQCADYDRLAPLCRDAGTPILEDAAEALGATYQGRPAGSFGAAGVLSFNGNKVITTSGGGAALCHDEEMARRVQYLASQARMPALHYEHDEIGFNYRLSNLLAALGRAQLESLDDRVARRREIFATYRDALGGLPGVAFMPEAAYGRSNRWLTALTVDPAEAGFTAGDVIRRLAAHDVEARPTWKPMHLQPVYGGTRRYDRGVAADLYARGLCLPSGSSLDPADQERVIALVLGLAGR